jgi:hypothetical protein
MSSPGAPAPERPVWKTGTLWGVLAVLLVIGTVGSATAVYGALALVGGAWLGAVIVGVGAVVALLAFLFILGVLYRVDRYRGALGRRIELFE